MVSYGTLAEPTEAQVSIVEQNNLAFTWQPCAVNTPYAHDQIMLMAYCVELNEACYEIHGAFRHLGNAELALSPDFKEKSVLVYLAFVATDRKKQSRSVYLGEMMVPV